LWNNPGFICDCFNPAIEIGWSFLPEFWGNGYATEAGERWLQFAFEHLLLSQIISFAVRLNLPSHAVMKRLGLQRDTKKDFDHPNVPDTHPELVRHIVYSIRQSEWHKLQAQKCGTPGRI